MSTNIALPPYTHKNVSFFTTKGSYTLYENCQLKVKKQIVTLIVKMIIILKSESTKPSAKVYYQGLIN